MLLLVTVAVVLAWSYGSGYREVAGDSDGADQAPLVYQPREAMDTSGFNAIQPFVRP